MLSLSINSYRATQELNTSSTNISERLAGAKKTSTGNDDAAGLEISNRLSEQLGTRATISAEGMALSRANRVEISSSVVSEILHHTDISEDEAMLRRATDLMKMFQSQTIPSVSLIGPPVSTPNNLNRPEFHR